MRSVLWVGLGVLSAACAVGALGGGPPQATIEGTEATEGATTIAGGVFDSQSREPIESALLLLQCDCLEDARETETNADGLFAFRELPPGTYTVQVLHRNANAVQAVPLGAEETVRLRFVLSSEPLSRT